MLLNNKLHISEVSEKSQFPSLNYHLEVDVKAIYKSESCNYGNSNMTQTQH